MAEASEPKALPEAEKKKEQTLPFYKLFSFADKCDWMLMISGSIGAIVHGSSMPVFFLLFGEMVNGFGKNQMDLKKMTEEVSKVNYLINESPTLHSNFLLATPSLIQDLMFLCFKLIFLFSYLHFFFFL